MNFFGQVNVVVGAFFVLSGYVTAYTATTNGAYEADPKLKPSAPWIMARIFGYFPLHLIVLAIFSPIFLYADVKYNGWLQSAIHGLMSATMTQCWFPMNAEVWNAPSWFLGALAFATTTLPFALPPMAKMTKPQLKRTMLYLVAASLIPKLGYSYDHNVWGVMEGVTAPKAFPNLAIFNTQRFNPFFATVEVLLGAAACRVVMLDGVDEDKDKVPQTNTLSTLLPLMGMLGVLILRATEILKLNDLLTRCLLFLPLFLRFMMSAHRAAVAEANGTSKSKDLIVGFLSSPPLTALGALAFPMFLVHGPLGQLFYKKIVATRVFGGTLNKLYGANFFYVYLTTVVASAFVLKKLVLESKAIGTWSKETAAKWSKWM
jgi:peptidoglycan/LPS O-acetylase OafA/YrhL